MRHLFLHGLGQNAASWEEVLSALRTEGDCPELFSLFSGSERTYQALYRGVSDYCEGMDGTLLLCGLSLGAVLALHYALDHPGRVGGLVLIAPQYKMPKRLLRVQNALFRCMPSAAFAEMGVEKEGVIALTSSMLELDFTDRLRELHCPVLILCGEKDRANRRAAKELVRLLPSAELKLVEGAGHEVNREAPGRLAEIWTEFVSNAHGK